MAFFATYFSSIKYGESDIAEIKIHVSLPVPDTESAINHISVIAHKYMSATFSNYDGFLTTNDYSAMEPGKLVLVPEADRVHICEVWALGSHMMGVPIGYFSYQKTHTPDWKPLLEYLDHCMKRLCAKNTVGKL